MNNSELFDTKSGISIEEQQEILSKINGIAEKNRQSLSQSAQLEQAVIKPKKNGAVFPLAVNAAAIALLAAGAFLLIFFNSKVEAQVRTGNAVFNSTERALIDEIRKDTAEAIAAKENEIANIASRLNNVDEELLQLYSSNLELTAEQRAAQNRLLAMQQAFREELTMLEDERSQILETSRSREARLRAQLDERAREFAAAQQRTESELDAARRELERLTLERERLIAVEALFTGGQALMSERVQTGQFDQAEALELMSRNAQLQDNVSELQKTIDALSSGGTGLTQRVNELEGTISALRRTNTSLEHNLSEKDSAISSLNTENQSFTVTINQLRDANSTQEQEISNLRNQITIIRQALMEN